MNTLSEKTPVIIGLSFKLPFIEDETHLWEFLLAGKRSRSVVDLSRNWRSEDEISFANLLPDLDFFCEQSFELQSNDVALMDPQQKLALYGVKQCIAQSGMRLEDLQEAHTSVFAGVMSVDMLHTRFNTQADNRFFLNHCEASVANRVSHNFNFKGESKSINAACASSLIALKDACLAIENTQTDFAFVIGVNYLNSPLRHASFKKAGMLSRQGWCNTFSIQADGYLATEGMVTLLLTSKSLAQKIQAKPLAAVVAYAANHNGQTQTMTAPSAQAQSHLIQTALKQCARLDVGYVEAHGTGTNLGDSVELEALSRTYKDCIVGSIKANLGHMEAGSGLLSVLKALLILKHETIPPHPLVDTRNLLLPKSIEINLEPVPYCKSQIAVSSFGFGGANAHVILEKIVETFDYAKPALSMPLPINTQTETEVVVLTNLDAYIESVLGGLSLREDLFYQLRDESLALYRHQYSFQSIIKRLLAPHQLALFEEEVPAGRKTSKDEQAFILLLLWARVSLANQWQLHTVKREFLESFPEAFNECIALMEADFLLPDELPLFLRQEPDCIQRIKDRLAAGISRSKVNAFKLLQAHAEPKNKEQHSLGSVDNCSTVLTTPMLRGLSTESIDPADKPRDVGVKTKCQQTLYCLQDCFKYQETELKSLSLPEFLSSRDFELNNLCIRMDSDAAFTIIQQIHCITKKLASMALPETRLYLQLPAACSSELIHLLSHFIQSINLELKPLRLQILDHQQGYYQYEWVLMHLPKPKQSVLKPGGKYVLVGGAGGIGMKMGAYLKNTLSAEVSLLGRSPWDALSLEVKNQIEDLGLSYQSCDIRKDEVLLNYLRQSALEKKITGLFHFAMERQDGLWTQQTEESIEAKLHQISQRNHWLQHKDLPVLTQYLYVFTSIQAYCPNLGASFYSLESLLKAKWTLEQNNRRFYLSILGVIDGVGLANAANYSMYMEENDLRALSFEDCIAGFEQQLASYTSVAIICGKKKQACHQASLGINKNHALEEYVALSLLLKIHDFFNFDSLSRFLNVFQNHSKRLVEELLQLWLQRQWLELDQDRLRLGFDSNHLKQFQAHLYSQLQEETYLPRLGLFEAVCDQYPDLLLGKTLPQQILFPGASTQLVKGFYSNHPVADYANQILAKSLAALCSQEKPVKILEVGAGSGASTIVLLEAIKAKPFRYYFTDISQTLVKQAKNQLADYADAVIFSTFDLERLSCSQEFYQFFDFIIATNVVHASSDINQSLSHLYQCLAEGGTLLLNELVEKTIYSTAVFGVFDAWWQANDRTLRIQGSPLLSCSGWLSLLQANGFKQVESKRCKLNFEKAYQAIIIGQKPFKIVEENKAEPAKAQELIQAIAQTLCIDSQSIGLSTPFSALGFDSLSISDLYHKLRTKHPNLSIAELFAVDSVEALFRRLEGSHAKETEAQRDKVEHYADTDIAIVGLSYQLPQGEFDSLLDLLQQGGTAFAPLSSQQRWPHEAYFDSDKRQSGKYYAQAASFLKEIDCFDEAFFKLSPREAAFIDPQERLLLQNAYHALEDANAFPIRADNAIGVFVGLSGSYYSWLMDWQRIKHANTALAYWSAANRISYSFNLQGPSMAVDTACSSSLTALHLACQSILMGESSMALVAAANLIVHPRQMVALSDLNMLSSTNKNASFAQDGDGFIYAEGLAAVCIKPCMAAIADGDRIYGIIKASALNSGGGSQGYLVPNPCAQSQLMQKALDKSKLQAADIQYIEAHGTGTALGDPIEIKALQDVYGESSAFVGSIKSNLGHAEACAGLAGLIKVLLQYQSEQIFPNVNAWPHNELCRFASTSFRLSDTIQAWPKACGRRYAALSSFGAGGSNAHVILQDYPRIMASKAAFPFNKKTHWISDVKPYKNPRSPQAMQPLVLDPKAYYFSQHRLHQRPILPGVAHIYFCYQAYASLGEITYPLRISKINWINPIFVDSGPLKIHWLSENECQLLSHQPYSTMCFHPMLEKPPNLGFEVDKQAVEAIAANQVYERFRNNHWQHGEEFQCIESLWLDQDKGRAWASLTLKANTKDPSLDPRLFDSILQTVSVLQEEISATEVYIPQALEEFILYKPWTNTLHLFIEDKTEKAFCPRYDLQIFDESHQLVSEIKGFCMRLVHALQVIPKLASQGSDPGFKQTVLQSIQSILSLDPDRVNLDASFGDLGFNSILFTELAFDLNEAYALKLSPATFFAFKSVGEFIAQYEPSPASFEDKAAEVDRVEKSLSDDETDAVIIGFSARLPACSDLNDFWQILVEQRDVFSQTPSSRQAYMQVHTAAFIEAVDEFDPAFFNISPFEAKVMDPQQRLLLQEVWRALEMSAIDPKSLASSNTGVYVGASTFDYAKLLTRFGVENPYIPVSTVHSLLANRISYYFDLKGPSEAIDTACSSSLYALDKAVSAIKQGLIDQAIVCGVNLLLDDEFFNAFKQSGMLSSTGLCRPFDKHADGYVRGEGILVVILQRKSLAEAENKAIYAKILASAVNHSGKANTLTSPSSKAQQLLYERIYSKIDIGRVSYIEMHGTGTAIGDPVELEAWKQFIGHRPVDIQFGSVKGNIGHLEPASGLVGLLKILLMFQAKIIPGQAHLEEVNPYLGLEHSGLKICRKSQTWQSSKAPFVAALSSFGFGGVNAHVVIEQGSALFGNRPIPIPSFPFLRKKIWFKSKQSNLLYKETMICIDDQIQRTSLSEESLLFIYSSRCKDSMQRLRQSLSETTKVLTVALEELAQAGLKAFINQHSEMDKIIVYLDISPFSLEVNLFESPIWTEISWLFETVKALNDTFFNRSLSLDVYTYCSSNIPSPLIAMISGFLASFSKEMPHWRIKHTDMDQAFNLQVLQSHCPGLEQSLLYHQGRFWKKDLLAADCSDEGEFLQRGATYLILGGMGGIGRRLSQYLIKEYAAKLVVVGRSRLHGEALVFLNEQSQSIEYIQTDLSQELQSDLLVKYLSLKYPKLDAVFDLVMQLDDASVESMSLDRFQNVMRIKVLSAYCIQKLHQSLSLKAAVFFSSMQSYACLAGQSNYAAACAAADAYATHLGRLEGFKVKRINWSIWQEVGAVADDYHQCKAKNLGFEPLSPEEAWEAMIIGLNSQYAQFAVQKKSSSKTVRRLGNGFETVNDLICILVAELKDSLFARPTLLEKYAPLLDCLNQLPTKSQLGPIKNLVEDLCLQNKAFEAYYRLAYHCYLHYPSVLTGQQSATDVIFSPKGLELLTAIYEQSPQSQACNQEILQYVDQYLKTKQGRLQVLELGAGIGATSKALVATLNQYQEVDYFYTDVSSFFLNYGKKLQQKVAFTMHCQSLDINHLRQWQHGSLDIIIASNVIHLASDLPTTLNDIRHLLKANGIFLLNEAVKEQPYLHFIFGLFDGWWQAKGSERLKYGPLLNQATWQNLLEQAGLTCQTLRESSLDQRVFYCQSMSQELDHRMNYQQSLESIRQQIADWIRTTLDFSTQQEIPVQRPLAELGLDSISGVLLIRRINQDFRLSLRTSAIFDYPSLEQLAAFVYSEISDKKTAPVLDNEALFMGELIYD